MKKLFLFFSFLFVVSLSFGQVQLNSGVLITIDFDNTVVSVNNGQYAGTGFTSTPSSGQLDSDAWATTGMSSGSSNFGGTATSGDFARGSSTGGVTLGGFYAFDVGSSNYSFGIQPGIPDWTPGTVTLRIQNKTGSPLSKLNLQYDIYINNDQNRANSLYFSYSEDDNSYTPINSLDYTSPGTSDAFGFVKACTRTTSITGLNVVNDGYVYIRWTGNDVSGLLYRDEFALDNILLSEGNTPLPVTLTNFTASIILNEFVLISWTTESESNMSHFNLYRDDLFIYQQYATNTTETVVYEFVDIEIEDGETYSYLLEAVELDGSSASYGPYILTVEFGEEGEPPDLPEVTFLRGNYPNPFNPSTTISFNIKEGEVGTLSIYNIKGQVFESLKFDAGTHNYEWFADEYDTGIYFYKLESSSHSEVKKMLILK